MRRIPIKLKTKQIRNMIQRKMLSLTLPSNSPCCQQCCGRCENDLIIEISGVPNWNGSYLLPNEGNCGWHLYVNNCGECSRISANIVCDDPEAGDGMVYQITLYEYDCVEPFEKPIFFRLIEPLTSPCSGTKTLTYVSSDFTVTCGPYEDGEITFTLTNNLCCACCTPCCGFINGDQICATITSACEHWNGRQYTLTFSEASNKFECTLIIPDGEFAGSYGELYLSCTNNAWESEVSGIFSTLSIDITCSPFSGSVEHTDTTWPVCTGVPITITYSEC